MERRFSMNDFERSLKEHADEFKMIPSKKVWHGIYNDMHPGRRWPSVAMSLALIFTLVVIGHLNTHNGSQTYNSKNISLHSEKVLSNLKPGEISKIAQKTGSQSNVSQKTNVITSDVSQPEDIESKPGANINNNYSPDNNNLITDDLLVQNLRLTAQSGSTEFEKNILFFPELNDNWNYVENNILDNKNIQSQNNSVKPNTISETIKGKIAINNSDNLQSDQPITIENTNLLYTKLVSDNKDNNIDNNIVKNKPGELDKKPVKLKQKKNDKISWVYFVAPQINSVSFSGAPIKPLNINNSPAVAINQKDYKVLHTSALGFEAGTQINYTLTKKMWFTSGLHITYSGYNIISNEVHPTFANLFLKDPGTGNIYSKSYITHYGNGTAQSVVSIRNYNLQASVPIGLQYEFFGNNKVQLNADANFEPSMVVKSNAYLLSSDGNNYVNDHDLLRKINMSSNFGVFVSFISTKFKWQIGPNVRYQWLSTYIKDYTVKEHLIDYGIRIGISPIRK